MKRILYLDKQSNEIENLLQGNKNVIVRGANIRKYPYKMIDVGYRLYFLNNNKEGVILASATVEEALFIEESNLERRLEFLSNFDFRLTEKKMKYVEDRMYISIFKLKDIKKEHATFDSSLYGKKDDWLIINDIETGDKE